MFAWLFGTKAVGNNTLLKFKHVVCHRGLHDPQLEESNFAMGTSQLVTHDQLVLPVENSLLAYRSAWALGFTWAECDITSTVDGEVFLVHDETFERVAALDGNPLNKKRTTELTSAELARIRLRDDSSAPTLMECLELAKKMSSSSGTDKKLMVVEMKQDGMFPVDADYEASAEEQARNLATAERMVQLVTRGALSDAAAAQHVGLIFTFGPDIVRLLCQWKLEQQPTLPPPPPVMLLTEGPRRLPQNKSYELQLSSRESVDRAIAYHAQYGGRLDGLFVEFEPDMLVPGSVVQQRVRELVRHMKVGVWFYEDQIDGLGFAGDDDARPCFERLLDLGVWLVNANIKKDGN